MFIILFEFLFLLIWIGLKNEDMILINFILFYMCLIIKDVVVILVYVVYSVLVKCFN